MTLHPQGNMTLLSVKENRQTGVEGREEGLFQGTPRPTPEDLDRQTKSGMEVEKSCRNYVEREDKS